MTAKSNCFANNIFSTCSIHSNALYSASHPNTGARTADMAAAATSASPIPFPCPRQRSICALELAQVMSPWMAAPEICNLIFIWLTWYSFYKNHRYFAKIIAHFPCLEKIIGIHLNTREYPGAAPVTLPQLWLWAMATACAYLWEKLKWWPLGRSRQGESQVVSEPAIPSEWWAMSCAYKATPKVQRAMQIVTGLGWCDLVHSLQKKPWCTG
jgi:hypothetical protein